MDTDLPTPEEPSDQPTPTMDEQSPSQVRSYECFFCKRGFSNAQALGGHMNIHRKDKAKLKKSSVDQTTSSQQQHQSCEINISHREVISPNSSLPTTTIPQSKLSEWKPSDEGRSSNIAWPNWMLHKEEISGAANQIESQSHGRVEVKQLSLFLEKPRVVIPNDQMQEQSMMSNNYVDLNISVQDVHHERLMSHGESVADIDLELRLGAEPQDSSPTNKGIKRFF